jgi:CRISPR/Cas system-associated protein Cas5 (RAMP superfamily)
MKILRGDLTETRYSFPSTDADSAPMEIISEKTYKKGAVAYMADELGVHRIWNKGSDFAVSLHRTSQPKQNSPGIEADLA